GGPVPQTIPAPKLSETQQKERLAIISRKLREAQRQDSARTGNKLEPGTMQQFHITNMQGPGEPIVTVARVKKGGPDGIVDGGPKVSEASEQTPAPPRPLKPGEEGSGPAISNGQKVYTYVEKMPHLPGGGGQAAIVNTIRQNVEYPKSMTKGNTVKGRVFAQFLVNAKGEVQETKIVKGLNPDLDNAVLASIKQLPRFEPGRQNGKPVAVTFTVPISFQ
ncbi:MAG: energy transducer TonB, partial [Hymenobacter sp.]